MFNPLEVNWKLIRVAVEVTLSEVPLAVTETTFKLKFPKVVVGWLISLNNRFSPLLVHKRGCSVVVQRSVIDSPKHKETLLDGTNDTMKTNST